MFFIENEEIQNKAWLSYYHANTNAYTIKKSKSWICHKQKNNFSVNLHEVKLQSSVWLKHSWHVINQLQILILLRRTIEANYILLRSLLSIHFKYYNTIVYISFYKHIVWYLTMIQKENGKLYLLMWISTELAVYKRQ